MRQLFARSRSRLWSKVLNATLVSNDNNTCFYRQNIIYHFSHGCFSRVHCSVYRLKMTTVWTDSYLRVLSTVVVQDAPVFCLSCLTSLSDDSLTKIINANTIFINYYDFIVNQLLKVQVLFSSDLEVLALELSIGVQSKLTWNRCL